MGEVVHFGRQDIGPDVLTISNIADIATEAREFAEALETSQIAPRTVLVVFESDGDMHVKCWGQAPSILEALGTLELAKQVSVDTARANAGWSPTG
jgi:hypothetical protein